MEAIFSDAKSAVHNPAGPSNQGLGGTVSTEKPTRSHTTRARTARKRLEKLGLECNTVRKSVYIYGHEWDDIREYLNKKSIHFTTV